MMLVDISITNGADSATVIKEVELVELATYKNRLCMTFIKTIQGVRMTNDLEIMNTDLSGREIIIKPVLIKEE